MVCSTNISKVIASIENNSTVGFHMGIHVCKADKIISDKSGRAVKFVACIAGHAVLACSAQPADLLAATNYALIEKTARDYMGLTDDQARRLFFDLPDRIDLENVTPQMAVMVLKDLAVTGEVRWLKTFRADSDPPSL